MPLPGRAADAQAHVSGGSISAELGCPGHVRFTRVSDRKADIASGPFGANSGNRPSYSITSSTIESTPGGTVRPRFAAVFRLHLDPGLPKFEQMPPM